MKSFFSKIMIIFWALIVAAVAGGGFERMVASSDIALVNVLAANGDGLVAKTWIEFPPDGETLPMEPVPIAIYAAYPGGVGTISAVIGGQVLPSGVLTPLTIDGSNSLVRTDMVWQPTAQGKYTLEASAGGSPVSVTFCIVSCFPEETEPVVSPTPTLTTPTVTFTPETTLTPLPTTTWTPIPTNTQEYPAEVSFWADPPYINAGECTTLNWEVYGAQAVYLDGEPVSAVDYHSVCLCETTDFTLSVQNMDNTMADYWTTVEVYGSCETPTETEPPPPEDTTGPDIGYTNLRWDSGGCQFFGQAGSVTDPSGVASVTFFYNLNDEGWMSIEMYDTGGGIWETSYGVPVGDGMDTPIGDVQYYVIARDSLGNENESGNASYSFMGCGG